MAVILIVLSNFVSLFEGIFIKKYNSKHSAGGFIFTALTSFFSMLFFIFTDKNGFSFPPQIWCYGIIAGICYASASLFTYIALSCGSFALTMLILSYSVIISIVYGIVFLKESTTLFTYLGIVLVLISIYFIKADRGEIKIKKNITPFWIFSIFISLIGSGLFGVLKRAQQIRFDDLNSNEFMIICLGFSTVAMFVAGVFKDWGKIRYIFRYGGIYAALSGLSNGATNILGLIITTLIPISISSPLSVGIKNLLSFLVAVIIFKEPFKTKQLFGVIIGTLALILFRL